MKITDIKELNSPRCLVSCSLDGKIKIWDYFNKCFITEIKEPTNISRGIRGLTYTQEYGGNLLSYGFDNYMCIWCPEVSLSRPFSGKLEGHTNTVVCCKFIKKSPNCVSADDKSNIRIWDIRNFSTI